jgi:hypothetical protein
MRIVMVVVAILVAALPVTGQSPTSPRTPWGDPDLQGFWPSAPLLSVPLERPVELGKKATLTEEEFARLPEESRVPGNNDLFNQGGSRARLMEHGKPQRQTSLIVDPPDGRLPPLTAEGARRLAAIPALSDPHNGPEDFSVLERCVSRGAVGSMLPVGNTNGNQIIQAPGVVVILNEMVHEARVIRVDGHPHLGAKIRSYMGDSRGRWEGQTLVVETINFNDNSNHIGGAGSRYPSYSRDARLTERFTRIDADTIRYEATVDDPRMWTQSWTVAFPLKRDPGYDLFEYACHEQNYSMPHMLRGERIEEKSQPITSSAGR